MNPSQIRQTHTLAILPLSQAAYDEIRTKLRDAGYDHALHDEGISLHGLMAQVELGKEPIQEPLRRPGGSRVGRLQRRSKTGVAGIRFEWFDRVCGPMLMVCATWVDVEGHRRRTAFSIHANGMEQALDRAIAARTSAGAPMPDRAALLDKLRAEFATRGQA